MTINGYSIKQLLVAIDDYFINGYQWLFYQWLLVVILLVPIGGYFISGYSINDYQWLFY